MLFECRKKNWKRIKKEITDSINHAKRIQESILSLDNYWKSCLSESFIFYRPKEIMFIFLVMDRQINVVE